MYCQTQHQYFTVMRKVLLGRRPNNICSMLKQFFENISKMHHYFLDMCTNTKTLQLCIFCAKQFMYWNDLHQKNSFSLKRMLPYGGSNTRIRVLSIENLTLRHLMSGKGLIKNSRVKPSPFWVIICATEIKFEI